METAALERVLQKIQFHIEEVEWNAEIKTILKNFHDNLEQLNKANLKCLFPSSTERGLREFDEGLHRLRAIRDDFEAALHRMDPESSVMREGAQLEDCRFLMAMLFWDLDGHYDPPLEEDPLEDKYLLENPPPECDPPEHPGSDAERGDGSV